MSFKRPNFKLPRFKLPNLKLPNFRLLWCVCALIAVGPFIYLHKLFKAMNLLSEDYNAKG